MKKILTILISLTLFSCNKNDKEADAFGNFEALELTVSAESNGKIEFLNLNEGMQLEKNAIIGQIDTIQLYLNKQQLIASKNTIYSKSANVLSQRNVVQEQLKTAKIEQNRITAMFNENAATKRQVDEISGKVKVLQQQINSVETQNAPIVNEVKSIDIQIEKINDQLKKSKIINPVKGTVLAQYAEPNEITVYGKPLYKIADLSEMTLRVYFSETQLSSIKVGQEVNVSIDEKDGIKA